MYQRLPFEQYFIDTSRGYGGQTPSVLVKYKTVEYEHHDHKHNAYYCVMYNSKRDVIQCYFKETTDDTGWKANFEFWEDYYDSFEYEGKNIQLKVATGWNIMYRAMKHFVRNEFNALREEHPDSEVEIIGWSLGSGQAQLCAQDLFYNYGVKAHVFTYGSVKPWYGSDKDVKEYLSSCYKECYNFSNVNDVVTYLPPFKKYFMFNKVKIKQKPFCIFRLFNPQVHHTVYWDKKMYAKIK